MNEEQLYSHSIFLVEVDKIKPNPFQPRKEFDQAALASLADSIRQYGVLQPLVVSRKEVEKPDGGLAVEYELIAGERRLRASRLAGLMQVPVVIRVGDQTDKMKLELAIIENLQREDLNPIDRAEAFKKLSTDFNYKAVEIATKIGMSREYVSNTIRMLMLPPHMIDSLRKGEISEGHSRPLLMLTDRPAEQEFLHKDIILRRMTVREAERAARRIAVERTRKFDKNDADMQVVEKQLSEQLGTRVSIEKRNQGWKIVIDFANPDDLHNIVDKISAEPGQSEVIIAVPDTNLDDRSQTEKEGDDSDLYSVSNFTL